MQRGIRLFGWIFIIGGCAALYVSAFCPAFQTVQAAHYLMGTFFGVVHLAYGIYLYFTERKKTP